MKSQIMARARVFFRFLILVALVVGAGGCDGGGKETKIIVPVNLQPFIGELLKTDTAVDSRGDGPAANVLPYEAETPLASLIEGVDIVVTWWSTAVVDSFEAGDLSVLPMEAIAPDGVWPSALLDFLRIGIEPPDGLIGLPLAIDPWVMLWNRAYVAEEGNPPSLWEDITGTTGPVFGLAGSAQEARLGWVALLADAYPSPAGSGSLAPWRNGLRRFAQAQTEGLFQRASFSYPWSDALAILKRADVAALFAPMSLYRSLDSGAQTALEVRRPPDALGRFNFPLFADVLLAVVRSKSLEKPGVLETLQALADVGSQRLLSDQLGAIPARLDAPVRDGAAFTAVRLARTAAYFQALPFAAVTGEVTAELSDLSLLLLKSPASIDDLFSEHGL